MKQTNKTERSARGYTLLSARQKAVICQLAGKAFNLLGAALGYGDVTEWRHACVFDVTGREGLRDCDQLDYIPLYNYFAKMLGLPPKEDSTPRSALERALALLRDALQRWEFAEGYAASIMRARLGALASDKMPLSHMARMLGAEGVRQVMYTVINRGRERLRKAEAAGLLLAAVEVHASAATLPPGGLAAHFGARVAEPVQGGRRHRAAAPQEACTPDAELI